MVILSAALKGVPDDVLEAARVDGASEIAIFFRIIVPVISPTIAVVATTMIINLLKIFDIVYVMTGGNFDTNVIAVEFYQQLLHLQRLRHFQRAGGRAVARHHPGHDLQHPPIPRTGGAAMSAYARIQPSPADITPM